MTDIKILTQTASAIQRVIAENTRLKNQNVTLTTRVEALEKQLKEHEKHTLIMQKNQLVLAMNSEDRKEIDEELRKSVVTTLEEWSSELYQAEDTSIDHSNCSDNSYYKQRREKQHDKNLKRSQFIAMLEELLSPVKIERYLLNSDRTRVTDIDGKPVLNPDYTRPDRE